MSNTGITLIDVRNEVFDCIRKLKDEKMDVNLAREIRQQLQLVIETARVQVDFLRVIPEEVKKQMNAESIKAIAGTLRDRDAELDESLTAIERAKNHYNGASRQL